MMRRVHLIKIHWILRDPDFCLRSSPLTGRLRMCAIFFAVHYECEFEFPNIRADHRLLLLFEVTRSMRCNP